MTVPTPSWLTDFAIPGEAAGVVLALDFGDTGLWAARLNPDLTVAATATEPRITPAVLDLRIASYLRQSEAVPDAEDPAVFAELLDVCRRARERLIDRDSAMLMGTRKLRLVTISLDTVMAATVPEVNRTHGLLVELAGREPVAAIFLGPGTDEWPGLWEALTDRGFALLLPDDEFPATYAGDEASTGLLDAVPAGPPSLAWAAAEDDGNAQTGLIGADGGTSLDAADLDPSISRRGRLVIAAAAAVLAAAAGVGVAMATLGGSSSKKEPPVAASTAGPSAPGDDVVEQNAETTVVTAAEPADVRAARSSMKRYSPPTSSATSSPAPSTSRTSEAPPGPEPKPKPRPPRRTIPNPIPGLPPIVIG
ncbi:hypothetical protein GOHSU_36_00020 [Gordonia hirsuta DSM 44140 = NBRC 16056]|uniref:Uncharacterized protein n=1 Tax=Gordonia hirsuta DSM 44140 = NBRC 16056 TaxID=1121927 RepID=L7LBF4_9ACTN|nr:hypothetical protein [Gordonia hirsuta]GAC58259.1 hypothetical protein GOHSU_36_00020 [Gordonia hirsuta DSM 44140 = NBRC 16056]